MTEKIKDVIRETDSKKLENRFIEISEIINELSQNIRETKERNEKNLALYNILKSLSVETYKVLNSLELNENLAWSTRNLFETNIILRNILENNMIEKWVSNRLTDEIQLLEGLKSYSNQEIEHTEILNGRIEEIKSYAIENSINLVGHTDMRTLSKNVNLEEEYLGFYKFYSKYVHPTSWSINVDDETKNSNEFKNILLINNQKYLIDSVERIKKYFNE